MDDGKGGDFISLVGKNNPFLKLYHLVNSNIEKGVVYRFRYRASNLVGWGLFSDIAFIRAASIPTKPPAPTFVSAKTTTISLSFE